MFITAFDNVKKYMFISALMINVEAEEFTSPAHGTTTLYINVNVGLIN
jgi:hypothetical protein